jgi:hypothetical protein
MSDESWARVSLRIATQNLATPVVEKLMGRKSSAKPDQYWAMDVTADSKISLDGQLNLAKDFLREKAEVLESLSDSEINLSIGWTPRSPQDGIVFDVDLIALLSRLRCYVLLDTYLD